MHFAWKLVWLWSCVGVTLIPRLCLGCQLSTIFLVNLDEDADSNTILGESGIATGVVLDVTWFTPENGYDFAEAFKVEIDRSGTPGTFKMVFKPGDKYGDYVDIIPRNNLTNTFLTYTCDGSNSSAPFLAEWNDKNNRAPEFLDQTPHTFSINTFWDKTVPLNFRETIRIRDQDFHFDNAITPTFTTTRDDVLRVQATPLFEDNSFELEYLFDVSIFVLENYPLEVGSLDIDISASDGENTPPPSASISITLNITSANASPPKFTQTSYHHKLTTWPSDNYEFTPTTEIRAVDPDNAATPISYTLTSTELQFVAENDPTRIKFISGITPSDPRRLIMMDITATMTKGGIPLESKAALIIELPDLTNPVFRTDVDFMVPPNVEWNEEGGAQNRIVLDNVLITPWDTPEFFIDSVYPAGSLGNFAIDNTADNSFDILYQDIMADSEIRNGVILVTIRAEVGDGGNKRSTLATVALYFPEKPVPTTDTPIPTTDCPTWTTVTESCPPCTTTEGTSTPTTPEPIECTPATPTTCEPTDCPTTTTDPSFSCPTQPPTTCPTTCEPCDCSSTDPSTPTGPTVDPPTTCPTIPPPTTFSTMPPITDCPLTCPPPETTCPTIPPPTECPTECPPPTTFSTIPPTTECPTECPPPTTCPTVPPPTTCPTIPSETTCPTVPPPTECPTECPPPTTCPTMPPPTTCPTTPPPTECPLTCPPPTTCPSTCPPPTTCPTTPTPCPTCPPEDCDPSDDCEPCSNSNTGMLVGIIAVSVLLVGSLGLAGFLWRKWKSASAFSSFANTHSPPPNNPRLSFGRPEMKENGGGDFEQDNGWMNPAFSTEPSTGLEQVLTHPEPSTSAAALSSSPPPPVASPYMTAPLPGVTDTSTPMKSSLAKPKEIAPDYEEGLGKSQPGGSSSGSTKPKSGGVKIADEVEIITEEPEDERL